MKSMIINLKEKDKEREAVRKATEEFLAAGGAITHLESYERSDSCVELLSMRKEPRDKK